MEKEMPMYVPMRLPLPPRGAQPAQQVEVPPPPGLELPAHVFPAAVESPDALQARLQSQSSRRAKGVPCSGAGAASPSNLRSEVRRDSPQSESPKRRGASNSHDATPSGVRAETTWPSNVWSEVDRQSNSTRRSSVSTSKRGPDLSPTFRTGRGSPQLQGHCTASSGIRQSLELVQDSRSQSGAAQSNSTSDGSGYVSGDDSSGHAGKRYSEDSPPAHGQARAADRADSYLTDSRKREAFTAGVDKSKRSASMEKNKVTSGMNAGQLDQARRSLMRLEAECVNSIQTMLGINILGPASGPSGTHGKEDMLPAMLVLEAAKEGFEQRRLQFLQDLYQLVVFARNAQGVLSGLDPSCQPFEQPRTHEQRHQGGVCHNEHERLPR